MAFSLGGAFRGASQGLGDIIDAIRTAEEQKRRDAATAYQHGRDTLSDQEKAKAAALDAFMKSQTLNQMGGSTTDVNTAPAMPSPIAGLNIGQTGLPTREGREIPSVSAPRPVTMADILGGAGTMGRVSIDPSQSAPRKALAAISAAKTPEEAKAAIAAALGTPGVNPADIDRLSPPPKAPILPEWQQKGYPSEQAYLDFKGKEATATRAPEKPQILQGSGPGEEPAFLRYDEKTNRVIPVEGGAPKQTLHVESATNEAAKARLTAAISELNNAHNGMAEYEKKLASGQANISGLSQFMGSIANTFTHDDPVSVAARTTALNVLNHSNPELARYIRRGLSFAEGESMISQRPSDFRTRMSSFLSQAATGASPEMIQDIESRRTSILNPLNALKGAPSPHGATVPPSPSGVPTPNVSADPAMRAGASLAPGGTAAHPQAATVAETIKQLTQKLGRTPTAAEVKAAMGQ